MGRPGSVDDEKQVALYVFCNDEKGSGENDGLGRFFFCVENDVLCFFCRHSCRRRLLYSPNLQSVQGRTPACGNRSFPHAERGAWGASPPHSRVHAQQILRIPATGYSAA